MWVIGFGWTDPRTYFISFYLVQAFFFAYFFGLVSGLLLPKCEEYPMYV